MGYVFLNLKIIKGSLKINNTINNGRDIDNGGNFD